jgi:hypothetical protein
MAKEVLNLFGEDVDIQEHFRNNPWTGDKLNQCNGAAAKNDI